MSKKSYDQMIKIIIAGDSSVGKTSIIRRYTDDYFTDSFKQTIGVDFKLKTIDLNGKIIKLQIWDTAGQERFNALTYSYYRGAHGMILVYDLTDARTFENMSKWIRNIDENADIDVTKLMIGNKCDMEDLRVIPTDHAKQMASKFGIDFIETSAKENINIDKAFRSLALKIMEKEQKLINEPNYTKTSDSKTYNLSSILSFQSPALFNNQKLNCC